MRPRLLPRLGSPQLLGQATVGFLGGVGFLFKARHVLRQPVPLAEGGLQILAQPLLRLGCAAPRIPTYLRSPLLGPLLLLRSQIFSLPLLYSFSYQSTI
jgi:hypothetical protein